MVVELWGLCKGLILYEGGYLKTDTVVEITYNWFSADSIGKLKINTHWRTSFAFFGATATFASRVFWY